MEHRKENKPQLLRKQQKNEPNYCNFSVAAADAEDHTTQQLSDSDKENSNLKCAAKFASGSQKNLSESVEQNQPSTPTGVANPENTIDTSPSLPHSLYDALPCDPDKWPDIVSDTQRVSMVKRGRYQFVTSFSYSAAKRRYLSTHYKRVLCNGDNVARSWLVYPQDSDKASCFCCKHFGKSTSPFCSSINIRKDVSRILKEHENGVSHKKCFSRWLLFKSSIYSE